jgi:hypothetical protein
MENKEAQYLDPKDWQNEPCWRVRDCPDAWKESCPVWQYEAVYNCWEMSATYCQGQAQRSRREKKKLCLQCEVYRSTLVKPEK